MVVIVFNVLTGRDFRFLNEAAFGIVRVVVGTVRKNLVVRSNDVPAIVSVAVVVVAVGLPTRVFATDNARNRALVRSVLDLVEQQRAVLIGTPSVSASEELGAMLARAEVPHKILNARFLEEEAEIISQAGQPSRVTIATNMAGRGTDIIPHDLVKARGGLHVIATAMHSAARIDRQLVGRTARQGDPGSFQFLLSMQDPLLLVLSPRQRTALQKRVAVEDGKELPASCVNYFRKAQRRLEKLNVKRRKQMLKHEQQQQDAFRRMGLDPYLECAGD